ncbi:asparagine synthetase B [Methanobrevibacter cuticularis]|uniref:Putative asparagine synthetase [glutamine-hydrolyzing] n=1 Tax=Methanobrevibacter cuticularis TaxID=47311 RepID=A0A166CV00_9EURY|nr:asparagine synthase-related protein [Methanobrevibacter cuticularis]KZX17007.1 asparagine synthetase B [Methanobrevibacter cuticularis]
MSEIFGLENHFLGLNPVFFDNLCLFWDGEIYNFKELNDFLNTEIDKDLGYKSLIIELSNSKKYGYDEGLQNNELIIRLLHYFTHQNLHKNTPILIAIRKTMEIINGDFVFSVYDGENIAICRDIYGSKPLYYGYGNEENNNIFNKSSLHKNLDKEVNDIFNEDILHKNLDKEVNDIFNKNNLLAFAENRKFLWNLGIENIETLKPGYILFNDELNAPNHLPWKTYLDGLTINQECIKKDKFNLEFYKNNLLDLLEGAVYKRVEGLDEVGLIFSGGVDSTIIAKILKNISEKTNLKVKLYTVGTEDSKDILFAKKIAKELDLPLIFQVIDEELIRSTIEDVLIAIEEANIIKLGVGMTIHLSTKLAKEDCVDVVLSGQGADELFGGYHRYLEVYKKGLTEDSNEKKAVNKSMLSSEKNKTYRENNAEKNIAIELRHDIENMYHVNLERDVAIANCNNVSLRSPFLETKFVEFALNVPVKYKIKSSDDKLRKHILREIAIDLHIPDYIAYRPKKAAQYGSGIHKILSKKILKDFDFKEFLVDLKNNYRFKTKE